MFTWKMCRSVSLPYHKSRLRIRQAHETGKHAGALRRRGKYGVIHDSPHQEDRVQRFSFMSSDFGRGRSCTLGLSSLAIRHVGFVFLSFHFSIVVHHHSRMRFTSAIHQEAYRTTDSLPL